MFDSKWLAMVVVAMASAISLGGESPIDAQIRAFEEHIKQSGDDHVLHPKLAAAYVQKARETGDLSLYGKAEATLRKVLEKEPRSVNVRVSLASTLNSQHRFGEARTILEQVLKDAPDDPSATGIMGDTLLNLGDAAMAEAAFKKLDEAMPSYHSAVRLAGLYQLKGDIAEATRFFEIALDEAPSQLPEMTAWVHLQLGGLHFSLGDLDKAEAEYRKALAKFPEYPMGQERLAELLGARDKHADALAIYEKLLAKRENPHLQQSIGDLYALMNKAEEAKAWHGKALASYKASIEKGEIHYQRALAMYYADTETNGAEAVKWAQKDLESRQDIYGYDVLAWALYRNGDFKAAAEAIGKALVLGTKDAHLFYHAGQIYTRAGEFAKGKELIRKAFETNAYFQKFHAHR